MIKIFSIKDNEMALAKGDSCCFTVTVKNPDGSVYSLREGDNLRFSLRQNKLGGDILIEKEGSLIELLPSETKNLPTGKYLYDVVLISAAGEICTVIAPTSFEIRKVVHKI